MRNPISAAHSHVKHDPRWLAALAAFGLGGVLVSLSLPARAGGSCEHDVCIVGSSLADECSTCAATVCAEDPFCCEETWDQTCVDAASKLCFPCSSGSTGADDGGGEGGGVTLTGGGGGFTTAASATGNTGWDTGGDTGGSTVAQADTTSEADPDDGRGEDASGDDGDDDDDGAGGSEVPPVMATSSDGATSGDHAVQGEPKTGCRMGGSGTSGGTWLLFALAAGWRRCFQGDPQSRSAGWR